MKIRTLILKTQTCADCGKSLGKEVTVTMVDTGDDQIVVCLECYVKTELIRLEVLSPDAPAE